MRTVSWCSLVLLLSTPSVMAQVEVDVRLEKTQYLAGEPIFVLVEVRNVGNEPVTYSSCNEDVRLAVKGVERRIPPSVFGCFVPMSGPGNACVVDDPHLLPPGKAATFKYLLKEYDLGPGQYALTAVGKAGEFDRVLPLNVVAATASSRAHLRDLFRRSGDAGGPAIVLALARIGDRDDADFFAGVLEDATADPVSRRYAALGLGRIGGDRAVRSLEHALSAAPPEVQPSIAVALGNTRSRAAVPVLIGMFGNNPAQNEVCLALATLTHRVWCDGTSDDPAAKRTRWRRWWKQTGSRISIYGPDNCPPDSIVTSGC